MPDRPPHRPGAEQPLFPPPPRPCPVRVVVADDNPVVRAGLTALLSGREDITVVAQAADGREAYEAARLHRPDVVLLDVRMPGVDGLSALPHLVRIARVVMLTYSHEAEIVQEALRGGAGATSSTGSSPWRSWCRRCGTSPGAGPTSPRRRRQRYWHTCETMRMHTPKRTHLPYFL